MEKQVFKILFVVLFCVGVLSPASGVVSAQGDVSRPLDISYQTAGDLITFAQLEQEEIAMTGPYDGFSILFGLPADWELTEGAEIELSLRVSFNSALNTAEIPVISGGLMTVQFNSVTVDILSLTQVGDGSYRLSIPAAALKSKRDDGRMELTLLLDAGFSCDYDQQMIVIVHPTSFLNLPHQSVVPDTNLVNFPSPIYQDSVFLDSALVVIPDQPSSAELQGVLTVAAGLGNITKNNLMLDLVTASKVTSEQLSSNHLILIGKAETLPLHSELQLPLPVGNAGFQMIDGNQDDGVIEMVNSTWSTSHVVLVISGNTDVGVVKAAQALSTGVLRPNRYPNMAIIDAVQSRPLPSSQPVDQSLADLGYETELIVGRGLSVLAYDFYVPPGWTVASDAYFDLVFTHSALLNFDRSGLVVSLNGSPIGSARLTDVTASSAKNQVAIDLPASEVVPGINTLEIEADLLPVDNCSTPNLQGLWATVWADSILHLPLLLTPIDPTSTFDLSAFPAPFAFDPSLNDTAFVLPQNDLDAWNAAVRIAQYLGDQGNVPVVTLKSFYDQLPEGERANYNLMVVGRATQMPIVGELNDGLPAPFIENSDIAQEDSMQVIFRFPPDTPLGYLQLLNSPWNNERVIIAALGSTTQGVKWSGSALIDSPMRSQIAGNFAVINDQQVITTDTRLPSLIQQPPAGVDAPGVPAPSTQAQQQSQSSYERPGWILVALGLSAGLAVVVLLVVIFSSWSRNRAKRPKDSDQ